MVKLMNGTTNGPNVYMIDKPEFIMNTGKVVKVVEHRAKFSEDFFLANKLAKEVYIFTKEERIVDGERFVVFKAAVIN